MRKFLVPLAFCALMTGCSPTWFQDFKSDPVKQTDTVLNSAASIEQVAIVVFNQLKPMLPADKQAEFQSKFDGSIVALNKAMDAVRAAVKTAADAQVEHPDMTKVIADVVAAVDTVKSVIEDVHTLLKTPPVAAAPGGAVAAPSLTQDPVGYGELDSMVGAMKK
jgi:hypothetical protein